MIAIICHDTANKEMSHAETFCIPNEQCNMTMKCVYNCIPMQNEIGQVLVVLQ